MLKGGDGRTPTADADVWEDGKGSGDPTEESPAFQHPSCSGEKPVPVWACRLGLELTWTSSAPPAQSSGLGFGSSFSPTKHKFSLCVRTVLNYLASAFLPIHNSTGSCSEYFPTSGTWFWRSFFCLFVHWFDMKAWHYLSNKKMEAESIKFPLWRDPSANAVPSVADTAGNKVN